MIGVSFDEYSFRCSVEKSLQSVDRILDGQRKFKAADEVDHTYEDKYGLADLLTNTAIIATVNSLQQVGLTAELLRDSQQQQHDEKKVDEKSLKNGKRNDSKAKTLRFQAKHSASLKKTQTVSTSCGGSSRVTETTKSTMFGRSKKTIVSKIVGRVKEYHWDVKYEWELSMYSGTDVENRTVLQQRSASKVIITQDEKPSFSAATDYEPIEIPLTWLLQQIDSVSLASQFRIDRNKKTTRTPLRNEQAMKALDFFVGSLQDWSEYVCQHFYHAVQSGLLDEHDPGQVEISKKNDPIPPETDRNIGPLTAIQEVFCPILPFFEDKEDTNGKPATGDLLGVETSASLLSLSAPRTGYGDGETPLFRHDDVGLLIKEQIRTLEEKFDSMKKNFRPEKSNDFISIQEAELIVTCRHMSELSNAYAESMRFIEEMLRRQLTAAVGKHVGQKDLDEFVRYHNSKLLSTTPTSFCHSVRRPEHYPEGVLSIKQKDSELGPVETIVKEVSTSSEVSVPLNASTTIQLNGRVFLHGWLRSRFGNSRPAYELSARARQFSSFVLMIGKITGPTSFKPQNAIIVQNKDEVMIPLLLEEIPSAKEFKDAIKSLSLEQQEFAKSFRNMQLGTSVFGVGIVQIKPQLERLLGLHDDSLTKEIKLTQDLMELFIEHQVPSDLFSFDGDEENMTSKDMVSVVKSHVGSVMEVISSTKTKQLQDAEDRAANHILAHAAEVVEYEEEMPYFRSSGFNLGAGMSMALPGAMTVSREIDRCATASADVRRSGFLGAPPPQAESAMARTSKKRSSITRVRAPPRSSPTASNASQPAPSWNNPSSDGYSDGSYNAVDFTDIPKQLDSTLELFDKNGSICSNTIKTGESWERSRQENLLSKPETSTLAESTIKTETDKAFDLLDALSRSGSLSIPCSELHVMVSATHRFDKDVMETIIEDNINPIAQLEKSTLLFASTIHGCEPTEMIQDKEKFGHLVADGALILSDFGSVYGKKK